MPITKEQAAPLLYWMRERQAIYRRRAAGEPRPWTQDPVLDRYVFTNVFRELDKTTEWIRTNWREPFADHPMLPLALAIARRINWPPTLIELGFPKRWDHKRFVKVLSDRRARGVRVFTGAHVVFHGQDGLSAAEYHASSFDAMHALKNRWIAASQAQTFENVLKLPGFGKFGAYELVTELTHTKWLGSCPDLNTWTCVKRGSEMGLNMIMGRTRRVNDAQAIGEAIELMEIARKELGKYDPMFKTLTLRNIEDSLCEYSKYHRYSQPTPQGMPSYFYPTSGEARWLNN